MRENTNKKRKSQKYQWQSENHGLSPEEVYGGNDLWKISVLRWESQREWVIDDERGDATEEV